MSAPYLAPRSYPLSTSDGNGEAPSSAIPYDQFVVSHGKNGAVGVFTAPESLPLRRGQRVLVRTERGVEVGLVLCQATVRQARLLGATSSGALVRPLTSEDDARRDTLASLEREIFEVARDLARRAQLPVEILDVDILDDGKQAIVQFIGAEAELASLAQSMQQRFDISVRLENLAVPPAPEEKSAPGCDKPDCGRSAGGGGCTTCETGGGCSSCGSGKVDMRQYFGHLREKMETHHRTPLV